MSLDRILALLQSVGLSNPVEEMIVITDEPKIHGYLCFPTKEAKSLFNIKDIFGQGFDMDKTKAKIKAIAEFLERLCLEKPNEDQFLIDQYKLDGEFIDPALFCCYSREQIFGKDDFIKRIRKETYRWIQVDNLFGGKVLIPSQLVFLSPEVDDETPIRKERISTGAALGSSDNNYAFNAGFLEVIERDSCISAYLTKKKIPRIVNLPPKIKKLVDYLGRYQLEPNIFDVSTDLGVPSVLVITLDKSGVGPAVNTGSRSDFNYEDAINYSLLESIQCRRPARVMKVLQQNIDKICSLEDRFLFWSSTERINDLDFWLTSPSTIDYEDLIRRKISFENVLDFFQSKGYHIFTADITLPQIKKCGFKVLKVIIPELHPLYLNEEAKALYSIHHGTINEDKTLKPHPFT